MRTSCQSPYACLPCSRMDTGPVPVPVRIHGLLVECSAPLCSVLFCSLGQVYDFANCRKLASGVCVTFGLRQQQLTLSQFPCQQAAVLRASDGQFRMTVSSPNPMVCKQVVTHFAPEHISPGLLLLLLLLRISSPHWQLVIAVRGIRLSANNTVFTQFQGPVQIRSAHETVIYIAFHLLTVAMVLRLKIASTLVIAIIPHLKR